MRIITTILTMTFCCAVSTADALSIDVSKSEDTRTVTGQWDGTQDVQFTNRIQSYGPDVDSRGAFSLSAAAPTPSPVRSRAVDTTGARWWVSIPA